MDSWLFSVIFQFFGRNPANPTSNSESSRKVMQESDSFVPIRWIFGNFLRFSIFGRWSGEMKSDGGSVGFQLEMKLGWGHSPSHHVQGDTPGAPMGLLKCCFMGSIYKGIFHHLGGWGAGPFWGPKWPPQAPRTPGSGGKYHSQHFGGGPAPEDRI